jgi:hypothetical protein
MKRADANSWGDGDEDGKGEWVVKKVAAKAKKGLLRPSWGRRCPRSYWSLTSSSSLPTLTRGARR